jgi:hypothetical protein
MHIHIYICHDWATMQWGEEHNEIKLYFNARYIGPLEALLQLLKIPMHKEKSNVVQFQLHLWGIHRIMLIQMRISMLYLITFKTKKHLLLFILNNALNMQNACHLWHQFFLYHFIWDGILKWWSPCQREFAIGRVYSINPL